MTTFVWVGHLASQNEDETGAKRGKLFPVGEEEGVKCVNSIIDVSVITPQDAYFWRIDLKLFYIPFLPQNQNHLGQRVTHN